MKIITAESLAEVAASRWKAQYCKRGEWLKTISGNSEIVYERLKSLGENPPPSKVSEVIGNSSWVRPPACSECGFDVDTIIEVGNEPDYESETAYLCKGCVKSALAMFD